MTDSTTLTPQQKAQLTRRENAEKRAQWRAEYYRQQAENDRRAAEDKARISSLMRGIIDDVAEDRDIRLAAAVVLNGVLGHPYFSSTVESLLRDEPDIQAFHNAVEEIKAKKSK